MLEKIEVVQIEYEIMNEALENIFQVLHSKNGASEKLRKIAFIHNSFSYELGKIQGITDPKSAFEDLSMGRNPSIDDEIKSFNFHKL